MKIGIIGLGWLGEPLGEFLLEKGFDVLGSTTSIEKAKLLNEKGINAYPFFLNPTPEEVQEAIFDVEVLVINIPPQVRTKPEGFHLLQIKALRNLIGAAKIPKVIFISATSVYPDLNQVVSESDELSLLNTGNRTLLEAEWILWKEKTYDFTVIRLGGLLGDDRIPGIHVSNKERVVGHAPVNYIYRQDAIRLIYWIVQNDLWNETYNGVAPFHPLRKEVYEKNARTVGFLPPLSYEYPAISPGKRVTSDKILGTGFTFFHHPLHFPYIFNRSYSRS